ncbi:DUF2510 domain-containing protein [Streptomyces djakartensis]|uniref:DUF2510 domain-containing protein n=1 Tax=Streptomyces djakartensis TaxID=68193 RepID=UPI003F7F14D4
MTRETPSGWYPDPGQTSDGPATERWWDGRAWTDRIRPQQHRSAPPEPPATAQAGTAPDHAPRAEGAAPSGNETAAGDETASGNTVAGQPAEAGAPSAAGSGRPAGTTAPPAAAPGEPNGAGQPAAAAHAEAPGRSPAAGPGPGHHPQAGHAAGAPYPPHAGHPVAAPYPPGAGYPPGTAYPPGTGYPGWPGYPGHPVAPSPGRGRGLKVGAAVAAAVVVLAGIGVGVYALTGDDGSGGPSATSQGPDGDPGRRGGPGEEGGSGGGDGPGGKSPQPGQSDPPKIRSGSVTDRVSGISLPIPEGWYGQQGNAGAQVTSEDSYKCPGDTSSTCTKGGAYSAPAVALGTKGATPEEIAKADIAANAEESYGGKSYGGITQHDVLASRAVTVAGQKGYLVRWKAVTSKGADGIVESLAFPSPANAKLMVVVRFGVDADQKEKVLDDITEGIKASTGSGNGQDV